MAELSKLMYIVAEQGSPCYVFDMEILKERVKQIQKDLGEHVQLCYAMKANSFLLHELKHTDLMFEVCSPGEFAICKRAGVQMDHVILSGVNKQFTEIEDAMRSGVRCLTAESQKHFDLIMKASEGLQIPVEVLLRITSGNQFGMDEELAEVCIEKSLHHNYVQVVGLQMYSGTQKKTMRKIRKELDLLCGLMTQMNETYHISMKRVEYGPGFPVEYFTEDQFAVLHEEYAEICAYIKSVSEQWHLTLEMGRFIASSCGYYMTKVVDVKHNKGVNYCIVDGGIHHLNYYGQMMAMKIPMFEYVYVGESVVEQSDASKEDKYLVCGSLCTTADVIMKDIPLNNVQEHDILIFRNMGAYSITEGIYLFLSRMMPKVILLETDGTVTVARDYYDTSRLNYERD